MQLLWAVSLQRWQRGVCALQPPASSLGPTPFQLLPLPLLTCSLWRVSGRMVHFLAQHSWWKAEQGRWRRQLGAAAIPFSIVLKKASTSLSSPFPSTSLKLASHGRSSGVPQTSPPPQIWRSAWPKGVSLLFSSSFSLQMFPFHRAVTFPGCTEHADSADSYKSCQAGFQFVITLDILSVPLHLLTTAHTTDFSLSGSYVNLSASSNFIPVFLLAMIKLFPFRQAV